MLVPMPDGYGYAPWVRAWSLVGMPGDLVPYARRDGEKGVKQRQKCDGGAMALSRQI
jgi:hypothetical protein